MEDIHDVAPDPLEGETAPQQHPQSLPPHPAAPQLGHPQAGLARVVGASLGVEESGHPSVCDLSGAGPERLEVRGQRSEVRGQMSLESSALHVEFLQDWTTPSYQLQQRVCSSPPYLNLYQTWRKRQQMLDRRKFCW